MVGGAHFIVSTKTGNLQLISKKSAFNLPRAFWITLKRTEAAPKTAETHQL